MTSEISAIGVAVCGTFLVCWLLFKQRQKRPAKNWRWSSDGSGSDGGNYLGDTGNGLGDTVATIPGLILMPMGTAAIIPDPTTPATAAVPVTPVEVMAEEVVTAVAEEMAVAAAAINEWRPPSRAGVWCRWHKGF